MRIAIIGWGSLIWSPGNLEMESGWSPDGPRLPVEFARVSTDGRLTLVLVEGVPLQPTFWALSPKQSMEEAAHALKIREGTTDSNIGSWAKAGNKFNSKSSAAVVVEKWVLERDLDGAIWTALGPKKPNGENGLASGDQLISYLRNLEGEKMMLAREYIEKAPLQISTPLRMRIRRELAWG